MNYNGPSRHAFVEIALFGEVNGRPAWWNDYIGQKCDATIYPELGTAHVDSEVLDPPLPKYQTIPLDNITEVMP